MWEIGFWGEMIFNSKNLDVFHGALISWMNIHKARIEAIQEEMKAKMNINWENFKAVIATAHGEMRAERSSIWSEVLSLSHKTQRTQANFAEGTGDFLEGLKTAKCKFKIQSQIPEHPQVQRIFYH